MRERNMRNIGESLTEKIAVEVGHFIYMLFGVGLTCDVIEEIHRTIPTENNTNVGVCISHKV